MKTTGVRPARPVHPLAKELLASNGFLLARLGFGFKGRAVEEVERAGFELYDYTVLAILSEGILATQGTLADALNVDPSRLVALLDSLEERGLLERQRDPDDRRRHVVRITAAGKREHQRLRGVIRRLEDEFFAPLDPDARQTFHDLLVRLAAHNDPACAFAADDAAA